MNLRTLRSWAAVHQTWAGALLLVIALVLGTVFSSAVVTDMGLILLAIPVPLLLLVPVLAGIGVAMASVEDGRIPLPDPPRAVLARVGWALLATLVAVLSAVAGTVLSDVASPGAVVRNVVLHAGVGLLLARTDGRLIWVPGVLLTLLAMLFGQGSRGMEVAAWAFMLDPVVRPSGVVVAALVFLAGLAVVALPRRDRLPSGAAITPSTSGLPGQESNLRR